MSNLVEQILDAIELEVKTETGFTKLKYNYNLELNDSIKNGQRFGVRPKEASVADGLNKVYTVDQVFTVTLVLGYESNAQSDATLQTRVKTLYNKMDEVIKAMHLNKAGLPSIILVVNLDSIAEPEINEENKIVSLSADFIIKYRNTVD